MEVRRQSGLLGCARFHAVLGHQDDEEEVTRHEPGSSENVFHVPMPSNCERQCAVIQISIQGSVLKTQQGNVHRCKILYGELMHEKYLS